MRASQLTTVQMHNLDAACQLLRKAFRSPPFLVGTAGTDGNPGYRDVDVRLVLEDGEFARVCPTMERWEMLCLAISTYLSERAGVNVDFQIQQYSAAEAHRGPRNPLGTGRTFAGGGDGTPEWRPSD
jgi:hypothetical protein